MHGKKSKILEVMIDLVSESKINSLEVIKFESTNYLSKETVKLINARDPQVLGGIPHKPVEVSVTMNPVEAKPKTEIIERSDAPWKF